MTKKFGALSSTKFRFLLGASASALALGGLTPAMAENEAEDLVVTGASAAAAVAAVQDTTPLADEDRDVVVVTGSRIRRPVDETIAVTDIDAVQFETRAFTNTIEALEDLPFVAVGVNNQGNATQFGDNNAFVNLLNFGTNRTVTLIDGRRAVSSNQGTVFVPGNVSGAQVDLTIINPSLIKTTEIQTVGSGPIYGADAVAGVVNVILDRDFEGLEFIAQGGITDEWDGEEFRVSGAWGSEVMDGRGHVVLAGEYLNSNAIYGSEDRPVTNSIDVINNPLSLSGTDGIPDQIFQANQQDPQIPLGGTLFTGQTDSGSAASFIFPNSCTGAAAAFCGANGGQTPYQFALANPSLNGLDPLAFFGTFGLASAYPTVPVGMGSAEAMAGLTSISVPLTFDASGNPVALNLGNFLPPNVADQDDLIGAGGFDNRHLRTLRAAQDRYTFNGLFKYEFTPALRYEGDLLYSRIENTQRSDNFGTQTGGGSITAGNGGVPIFYDQNPFVTAATQAQIADIVAANGGMSPFGQIGGENVFYMTRSLADITGSLQGNVTNMEGNISTTWRTSHALYGEFDGFNGNQLYWDIAFAYSRNKSENDGTNDILDVEFALATDVVDDGTGNAVCRQQTLASPEAINVRNPFLTNINIATGITPTQAQIDACVPLNLFGAGNASQAAIDYVTAEVDSENVAQQYYGAASLGGDLFELPGGPLAFNSQFEWRRETLTFTPGQVFELGLARSTIGQPGEGYARFFEGGTELRAPIFGGDVRPFGFNLLELEGAVRVVNRAGEGTPNGIANPSVETNTGTAITFTAGGRYSPFEGITFRGNRTRAVRSPSIVESLGAPQTGFSGIAQFFPCNAFFRNGGPSSGIRDQNCAAFEQQLGLPVGAFASLAPPPGTVPAGVAGNPNLENEIANNYTVGVVLQPDFIPGLTIQSDYINMRLDNQIQLAFFGDQCFDQPTWPNTQIGGLSVCDSIILATGPMGNLLGTPVTIPNTNIITGNPLIPQAIPGSLAPVQDPFTLGAALFSNANAGSFRLEAINSQIAYSFDVADLGMPAFGEVSLNGYVYYIRRFEASDSGTFGADTVNNRGEPGSEKFQTRLDVNHRIGPFSHQLQWFRNSAAVENPDDTAPLDEEPDYFRPESNFFNYSIAYDINDNFTTRFVVTNLTDHNLAPEFGYVSAGLPAPDNGIGRRFTLRVDARF
ncbi:TonB-dependent receptor domain-containing protein [Hyphococcus sp.]|uniref:TonB-dependent receptor domain-containing protein n=1 Tax=Hyphococcus sp. TaxID=2038636 RepID=UPI003CCC24EB